MLSLATSGLNVRSNAACHEAATVCGRARLWDRPMLAVESDLARRMARLRRRSFARRKLSRAA